MKNTFVSFIILLIFPFLGASQVTFNNDLEYEVNRSLPPISTIKDSLREASTLIDINDRYPTSWIREYISVEVVTISNGEKRTAMSKNDILSEEQKEHMLTADLDTDIRINVLYMPENNLKHNTAKDYSFTFTIDPENEASFPGGKQKLEQYVKTNAVDKIPENVFKQYQLAAVVFTIDEEGYVTNPNLLWPSENEKVDKILLETVCNMPRWKPAEHANGKKVKQDFAFTVGDMQSCVVNLLNIRRLPPETN